MSINIQKLILLPKATQKYAFSKITTFETLLAMPHSPNFIGNGQFLTVFRNPKSE